MNVTDGDTCMVSKQFHRLSPKINECIECEMEEAMNADVIKQYTPINSRPSHEELERSKNIVPQNAYFAKPILDELLMQGMQRGC
jgi:hypothetical protein